MKATGAFVWATVLLVGTASAYAQLPSFGAPRLKTSQVQATLLADRTALVPGERIELAVQFKIADGWHIYWQNPGESGYAPRFNWRLPVGFEVGPARYPPPERHVDDGPIVTFILEGSPVLLTTLDVPADAEVGQEVSIGADVRWLVCSDKSCVPESDDSLKLTLPVVANKDESKPANESVFKAARKALPAPAGEAEHLRKLIAAADVDRIKPGAKFRIAVVLEVADGVHVNSHEPKGAEDIPLDMFPARVAGLMSDPPVFPEATVEDGPLGPRSVYRGQTKVMLPVEADGDVAAEEIRISGVVTYVACSDETGRCYPKAAAEWELTLPIAGPDEEVSAANPELFSGIQAGMGFTLDSDVAAVTQQKEYSLPLILALALLAGLILNVTPCVLPVISIKVLSFVQQASESPARVLKLGLAFSLGMMIVFNILAILATGVGLVWGQHFQSPTFTIGMAAIIFAFGLSLFGVFTLGVPRAVGGLAAQAEGGEGYLGSVAKGMLATVMGTPCLGPFLGSVLVWATAKPAPTVFLVFNTIGVGMALPYVLLTANPRWLRFVPKPGPWLETFKQAMGFLLLATVVYLLYILEGQLGGAAVVWALVWFIGVGVACWIVGRWLTLEASGGRRATVLGVALLVVVGSGLWAHDSGEPDATELDWVEFSMDRLEERTAAGQTVFLDITANWCPNCKANLEFVFNTAEVKEVVEEVGAVAMLADWTAQDKIIGGLINKLTGGGSIPLCAVFPAGRPTEPIVMLGIVTKQQVIDALREGAGGKVTTSR